MKASPLTTAHMRCTSSRASLPKATLVELRITVDVKDTAGNLAQAYGTTRLRSRFRVSVVPVESSSGCAA
jgi:hypothetical protein